MASGGRFASLDQLAAEAGAGPSVVDCLKARSLYHIPTLALVAASDVEFERNVFGPYKKGFVEDGFTHKPDDEDEANVAKAVLCHLWFGPLGVADGDDASAGVSPGRRLAPLWARWFRLGRPGREAAAEQLRTVGRAGPGLQRPTARRPASEVS